MSFENVYKVLRFVRAHSEKDHVIFCQHTGTRSHLTQELESMGYSVRDMAGPSREAIADGHIVRCVSWFNQEILHAPRRILIASRLLSLAEWKITRQVCVSSTYDPEVRVEFVNLIRHFTGGVSNQDLQIQTQAIHYESHDVAWGQTQPGDL